MSKVVDERVVEMRFDNRQFEQNVSTSVSTLDKLKHSLNLSGAAKGLSDIGRAAKGIGLEGIGSAVDTVRTKFSALQVMGVTALANITNSAVNAGKRIVNALTLEPVMSGFQEYETQMGAIQTILANTQSKGSTLNDVNKALDELNHYADKTIYNFTEMTRNIGTFTAAGIDLDTSVSAIQGIANLAAVSGSTSQQASTAMYQLSQALAAGTVKLMDWNSVVNAGMGGEIFQNALKKTSEELNTGAEAAIKAEGSFRESLTTGWLTSQVLTETLKKFTTSGANEYVAEYTGLSVDAVQAALDSAEAQYGEADAISYAAKALAEKSGKNEKEIKDVLEMAKTAEDAATKVRTFGQLWDTLKEAAQSGWTTTWQTIIGDFEEATEFLTRLSDGIGGVLQNMSDVRNQFLSEGLSSGWKQLLNLGIGDEEGYKDSLKSVAKEHNVAFDKMIEDEGSFSKALKKGLKEGTITSDMLSEAVTGLGDKIRGMSQEERAASGYTSEMLSDLEKLEKGLKDGSVSMEEFTSKIIKPSGRENLIESLFNSAKALTSVITPIKEAFASVFPNDDLGSRIYKFTERLREFTEGLSLSGETAKKVKDIFTNLFENVKVVKDAVGESLKNVFESLSSIIKPITSAFTEVFHMVDPDALKKVTSGFTDFTKKLILSEESADKVKRAFKGIFSVFDIFRKILGSVAQAIGKLFNSDGVASFGDLLLTAAASIGDFFTSLNEGFDESGLSGVLSKIISGISSLISGATEHMEGFSDVFSFVGGTIKKVAGTIWNALKEVFGWVTDNVSAGDVFAGLAGGGIFVTAKKFSGLIEKVKDAVDKLFGDKDSGIKGKFADVMGSVQETLSSFTSGIKISSIVAVAIAVGILSASMKTISELDPEQIIKSLSAIGIMLAMLSKTMGSIMKTLSGLGSKGLIKAGISLVLIAASVSILAGALKKMSDLSLDELAKGLIGVGIGLAILVKGLQKISNADVSFSTSIAILALAVSCRILASALSKFGEMSWEEIARGLIAMGGALGELVAATSILSKFGGGSSLVGGLSVLVLVLSLGKIADALKKFGGMSWDEINRGLTGMGGALTELTIVVAVLSDFGGWSSILGTVSIVALILSLGKIADAMKKFGDMSWDEIARGLVGMGGALTELTIVIAALTAIGKVGGWSSILGTASIIAVILSLGKLADAMKKFGDMSWDEIARGLVGMGGALTEVAVVTGVLGSVAGLPAILGGGAILLAVQGLGDLADALKKFGEMSWDEIGRGLTAMGAALGEVALGGVLNTLSGLGALSISTIAEPLGELADSLKKFGEMSWDEIGRGLTAMGAALGEVALGGVLNTLSGLGALSISTVAEPLGKLADSVKKWAGVTIPEGLTIKLAALAGAITSFTFSGIGAASLSIAAEPLGTLADSVKKWKDITVPEDLEAGLKRIATGVESFSFAFLGGWSLSALATPLGDLATSVQKWRFIVIPEDLDSGLKRIATGVKSFSFAFLGGWSLSALTGPLGDLATSVQKWRFIVIPEDLDSGLKRIATGVEAFSFAFLGAWSLSALTGPLGDLATSVQKWRFIVIPDDIEDGLKRISNGVKSFGDWFNNGGEKLAEVAVPLGDLATSIKNWNGVSVPADLGTNLEAISSALNSFSEIPDISTASSAMEKIASASSTLARTNFTSISSGLNTLTESIKNLASIDSVSDSLTNFGNEFVSKIIAPIERASGRFKSVGSSLVNSLSSGVESNISVIANKFSNAMTQSVGVISSKKNLFNSEGSGIVTALASGISSKASQITTAFTSMLQSAVSSIKLQRTNFYTAGNYLVEGFANGISDNAFKAEAKAVAMAKAALEAAEEEMGVESPSKEFYKFGNFCGLGFVNALGDYGSKAYKASSEMAVQAKEGFADAISRVLDGLDSDMDIQPTIRPVVDLDEVKTGVNAISDMFGSRQSIGVAANINAVSSMMNRRSQNGNNSNIVSAIDKIHKDINGISRPSYSIGGITYDAGSEVAEAIETLVRAAKIERRV